MLATWAVLSPSLELERLTKPPMTMTPKRLAAMAQPWRAVNAVTRRVLSISARRAEQADQAASFAMGVHLVWMSVLTVTCQW